MVKALTTHPQKVYGRIALLLSSLLITNFLFYIDEGYNDFRWMRDFGNWIVFVIYCSVLFLLHLPTFEIAFHLYRRRGRIVFSTLLSLVLTWGMLTALLLVAYWAG